MFLSFLRGSPSRIIKKLKILSIIITFKHCTEYEGFYNDHSENLNFVSLTCREKATYNRSDTQTFWYWFFIKNAAMNITCTIYLYCISSTISLKWCNILWATNWSQKKYMTTSCKTLPCRTIKEKYFKIRYNIINSHFVQAERYYSLFPQLV